MDHSGQAPSRLAIRIDDVTDQIASLLRDYCGRLDDRKTPVPDGVAATVRQLLREGRAIVSREPTLIPALPRSAPVTPGDVFVSLLATFVALENYAKRHGLAVEE